jgi:gliding motility-associated-like protein
MPNYLRAGFLALLFCTPLWQQGNLLAQCVGLPTVTTLGSNKIPFGFCSPVSAQITYNVSFLSNVPNGTLEIVIDWGDGTTQILPRTTGSNSYNADVTHNFPVDSDCEFRVVIAMRYNGVICPTTRQVQKVASWRTDEYNGGDVQLISPVTGTNEHLVCAGEDVQVIFQDATNFNCNANYVHIGPEAIETPNVEHRWQQIIYNTQAGAGIIPNVSVNGVAVTGGGGVHLISNMQDPRGVNYMDDPVVVGDPRRRPTLQMTAPGGFGPAFPQVGDVFELRIRYWNFCNPYSNDVNNPLVPVNGDVINGDNPPVERLARIRIVDAPPAPTGGDQTVCNGTTPNPFQVNGVPAGNVVNFYRDNNGVPGTLIGTPSTSTSLAVTSHPDWAGSNTVGRVYRVWASHRPNVVGSCESPRILITRTIRESSLVPTPTTAPPAEICNRDIANNPGTFTIVMPAGSPATEPIGGPTQFNWSSSLPAGISLVSNTENTATYSVNVSFAAGELFVDRTLTISRQFTTSPTCTRNRSFTIRIFNTAIGGTPSAVPDVCETTPVGTITLSGHRGEIVRWEVSKDGAAFATYTGPASGNSITPGILTGGSYQFRAVVGNGPCQQVNSAVRTVIVSDNPDQALVGDDQAFCEATFPVNSDPLGGNTPISGTGAWSLVSSIPAGAVTFTDGVNNPNTRITVTQAGAYTLRWTITNGSCVSSDDVLVDFGSTPTVPDPGNDKSVCGITTSLEGNTPVIGFGLWTLVSGPGSINFADNTSPTTAITLAGTPAYGTYTLRWTITSGTCPPAMNDVDITFFEPTAVSAADIPPVCIGPTTFVPINITGTVSGGVMGGTWENVSGNGTVSATSANGSNFDAAYTPNIDDYNLGDAIIVKLVANPQAGSPCSASEQLVTINIDRTPLANPGPDIPSVCGDAVQLNAESPPPFGATGLWTTATAGVIIENPTHTNTMVRSLPAAPSNTILTWTLTSASGLCVSDPASITITRVLPPVLTPYTALECEVLPPGAPVVTTVVLTNYEDDIGTLPATRSIVWYRNATPPVGTVVSNPSLPLTNIVDGQIFVARVTDLATSCSSDVQVTIRVKPLPPAQDAIIGICETDPVNDPNAARNVDLSQAAYINPVTGGASNVAVRWFPTFLDAQNETNELAGSIDVINSRVVHARVTHTDAPPACPDFAEVELRVNSIPDVSTIGGDPTVCMGLEGQDIGTLQISTYQVPSIPGAKYYWDIPQGPGQFVVFGGATDNDFFALLKFPYASPAPVETIRVRIEFNGCSTPEITMDIERSQIPVAPVISGAIVVCENSQGVEYNIASPDGTADYIWEIRRESDNSVGGAFIASGQSTALARVNFLGENVIISVQEENGSNGECVGPKAFHQVTVNRLPKMDNQLWSTCSDADSGIEFQQSADSPASIDYYSLSSFSIDPALTFTPPGPAVGNGPFDMLRAFQYKNTREIPLKVTYKVNPVSEETVNGVTTVCFGQEQTVVLDVNPEPNLESGLGRNVCSDEQTEITLRTSINSYPADKYVITAIDQTTNPGNPLVRVGPAAPLNTDLDADAIFNDVWVNPGSPTQDPGNPFIVTYRISAKNSVTGCLGTPSVPVPVAVFPKPEIAFTNDPVCSGNNVAVEVEAPNVSGTNTSWSWTVQNITANLRGAQPGTSPSGNTALIDDVIINESFTAGTVVYRVSAVTALGGKVCSNVTSVSVNVNPSPQVNQIPNTPICSTTPNNGLVREIDLTTLDSEIADPALVNIVWYNADPLINPGAVIADPTLYEVQNGVPVFALVTNSDAFGCQAVVPVSYTVNNAVAMEISATNVTCHAANNGSIYAEVTTGGTAPFYFRKDGEPFASAPGNNYTFLALAPNQSYSITVEDSKGCSATETSPIIIEPTQLQLQSFTATPVDCFFDNNQIKDRNGAINVVAEGSSGSYTYTLFPGGMNNTTGVFAGLRPGSYSVVVNDFDNPACKFEFSPAIVTVPDPIEILPVHVPQDSYGNQISCNGAQNGEIHVTARGGMGVYDFYLDPVSPQNPIRENANQPAIFTDLGAGTYRIMVEDINGCLAPQTSATIRDVVDLFPGRIGTDQNVCVSQAGPAGDAQPFTEVVAPFGGPGTYEYVWQQSVPNGAWFDIPGATAATYDADEGNSFNDTGTYLYRRLIRSALPVIDLNNRPSFCDDYKGQGDIVTIEVRPKPQVSIIGNGEVCQGSDEFYSLRLDVGTAPMRFTWDDGNFIFNNQTANQLSAPYKVSNIQQQKTVGFSNITDAYGCEADNAFITIDILTVDANFTVDDDTKCSGEPFEFLYSVQPDVQYVWEFGDGTVNAYGPGDPAIDGSESHLYAAGASSQSDAKFIVRLTAALDGGGCPNTTFREVTVRRSIILNITGAPDEICSGEVVTMKDNSTGVTAGTWYYEDENGNRGPSIPGPVSEVQFALTNTGSNNPLRYTIHYNAENQFNCTSPEYTFDVNVYRAVDADFTIDPNPAQMVGGFVTVTLNNTSDPPGFYDAGRWVLGEGVESVTDNGMNRTVVYNTAQQREIKLTMTNPLRPQCTDTHAVILNVNLENPLVDFLATRAGCYPLQVNVQNLSVSLNRFEWELKGPGGTTEKSNLREPVFNIYDPGTYTLTLKGTVEGNPEVFVTEPKTIEVFSKPVAEFFMRQNQVYTGSQVKPVNQSLFACAGCYSWDFGDGFTYEGVFEPSHYYALEGKYTVTLVASVDYGERDIDDDGVMDGPVICTDEASQNIHVIEGGALKIPNAFTPNVNGPNDGTPDRNFTNDVFLPIMDGVEEFTMQIFDRWGNMLFESREKNVGWNGYDRNGRLMPAGVYVYKVVLRLGDGQRTTKVGDVTLIR